MRLPTNPKLEALKTKTNLEEDTLESMFLYLFNLRDSGVTNMYGAGEYLEEEYEITQRQSTQVLVYWMENFKTLAEALSVEV